MEQVSKMDILLSFYQWRPVSLIPAMRDFNDPVVEEANRLSARDFKSNAIDPSFSGTVRMKAHGTPAEIGDYVEFNGGGLRFVSGRLRALLESMGQRDVQFFPADIETGPNLNSPSRYGGGPKLENFWWMHHWRRLDLIDYEASKIAWPRWIGPPPPSFDDWHIDTSATRDFGAGNFLIIGTPPEGEALYGIRRITRQRFITPELAAKIRDLGFKVSIQSIALTPSAEQRLNSGLRQELNYYPISDGG